MTTPAWLRPVCAGFLAAMLFAALTQRASAAEKTPYYTVLEIGGGIIKTPAPKQPPVPATLRNVIEAVQTRYRDATITLVGVEDVLVGDIVLRLSGRADGLEGALTALAFASGNKFAVRPFGGGEFLLHLPARPPPTRLVEVFNLAPFLSSGRVNHLENAIRETETSLTVLREKFGPKSSQAVDAATQLDLLKARLVVENRSKEDAKKLIAQIEELVRLTLGLLKSAEKPPEFQFHPGTNLLIAIGGDEAMEATRKVVAALERNPH